jgi:predicted deacetylase
VLVFLRNDDAGWDDDRLVALLELVAARGLPLDLAVIPRVLTEQLAERLRRRQESGFILGLHQHGYAHANHEREGPRCEFGPSRTAAEQRLDIESGRRRLLELLGPLVDSIFTPPWNRCTRTTAECLRELGVAALSREARAEPFDVPGLVELPVVVDWFAQRKGVRLSREALGRLFAEAVDFPRPLGVMLHHAELDDDELAAVAELLDLLSGHDAVRAVPMRELVPQWSQDQRPIAPRGANPDHEA